MLYSPLDEPMGQQMTIKQLLKKSRSYRRFKADKPIDYDTLVDLVSITRLCPSGANRQPLKYLLVCDEEKNDKLLPFLKWAAALKDWNGPAPSEQPTGYIVILGDTEVSTTFGVDHGIVAQSMMLAAAEKGFGGCLVGSIDRQEMRNAFKIPDRFQILLVMALGTPNETVVLEDTKRPGETDYWRDADQTHHVPKRPLSELITNFDQEWLP